MVINSSSLRRPFPFLLLLVLLVSCAKNPDNYDQIITISTRLGDIKMILFNDTPLHKASFLELAEAGAYDSTKFHRVMKDFMIQGGDIAVNPEYEKEARRLIPAEILPNHLHRRGAVGAARQPVSRNPGKRSSTQFYIVQGKIFSQREITTDIAQLNIALRRYLYDGTHQELIDEFKMLQDSGKIDMLQARILDLRDEIEESLNMNFEDEEISQEQIALYTTIGGSPHLDNDYTVFGQVVEGMATVDKIAALEVDSLYNPLDPVYLKFSIRDILKDSVTALYGIEYPAKESEPAQ